MSALRKRRIRWLPDASSLDLAGRYALAAITWLIITDWVVEQVSPNSQVFFTLSALKGSVFIVGTAVALYYFARQFRLKLQRYQESLQREDERLRALVENVSDAITVVDGKGIIQYESP